jgi:hypothetical protein
MGGRAPRAEWRMLTGLLAKGHQVSVEALSKYASKLNQIADAPDLSKRNCFSGAKTTAIVSGALIAAAAAPIERKILRRKVKLLDRELNDGISPAVAVNLGGEIETIPGTEFSKLWWEGVQEQEQQAAPGNSRPAPPQSPASDDCNPGHRHDKRGADHGDPSPWKID